MCVDWYWLELEQVPVDPVQQPSTSDSTLPQVQPGLPASIATQPAIGSAVEAGLPLEAPVTVDVVPSQHTAPSFTDLDKPPAFLLGLENQSVTSGEAAVFTVFFDGHPRPSVQWFISGTLVHSSDDRQAVVGGVDGVEIVEDMDRGTSTLTILSSTVQNEAEYTCRVNNTWGTAFTNAHLFVLGI